MSRYTGPKNRIARRFGTNIFNRARNPLLHKPNPPGVVSMRRRKKSDYGLQLLEQQKLKAVYGMMRQKQLVTLYRKAESHSEQTAKVFLQLLECRLDNLVYRFKFAPTPFAAQQLVAHGHILVDGKRVDRRSFTVKPGQSISIREKSRKMPTIQESVANAVKEVPEYLELKNEFEGKLVSAPELEQVVHPIEINVPVVCEFLAHSS
jgi:small subunit ribosomal protein S4